MTPNSKIYIRLKRTVFLLCILAAPVSWCQEICDNGIDDDGDGLIDLNDSDCHCIDWLDSLHNILPNPSFEERLCCPTTLGQLNCAANWLQASDGTTDYFNTCDYIYGVYGGTPLYASHGNGYVGFVSVEEESSNSYEYAGAELVHPIIAGETYRLSLDLAKVKEAGTTFELALFGSPTPIDLPWHGKSPPAGTGNWRLLTSIDVQLDSTGIWYGVADYFTVDEDINVVAIGGVNETVTDNIQYYFMDNLSIRNTTSYFDISAAGSLCAGSLTLTASVDSLGGTFQWYKDGIALIDENNETLIVGSHGLGEYTVVYLIGDYCQQSFHPLKDSTTMKWNEVGARPAQCRLYDYQNGNGVLYGSAYGGVGSLSYYWENNADSTDYYNHSTWGGKNPGTYTLTVTDQDGCALSQTVKLDSVNPKALFDVVSDQLNASCEGTADVEVKFINKSINIADLLDDSITKAFFWNLNKADGEWQFTDDYFEAKDTSYLAKGESYQVDVCLVAINKNGCKDTTCKTLTIYEPIEFSAINVFSPNGDGLNDVFTFEFKSASIAEFTCTIVNRWGEEIASLNGITDSWDGTNRMGEKVMDGLYFYTYTAISDNKTERSGQGHVQVIGSR